MANVKPRIRQRRTNEELQRASLAVQYELVTLATTHEFLQESGTHFGSPARERMLSNASLHSFLLAARSLLTFLYAHNPRETDIIAEDFFDHPTEWQGKRPVPEPAIANGELLSHISKRLAHLTWDRATPTKMLWGPYKMTWNIGLVLQAFLQNVAQERVHVQLHEDVALIMLRLEAMAEPWGGVKAAMAPATEIMEFDDLEYFDPDSDVDDD